MAPTLQWVQRVQCGRCSWHMYSEYPLVRLSPLYALRGARQIWRTILQTRVSADSEDRWQDGFCRTPRFLFPTLIKQFVLYEALRSIYSSFIRRKHHRYFSTEHAQVLHVTRPWANSHRCPFPTQSLRPFACFVLAQDQEMKDVPRCRLPLNVRKGDSSNGR